VTSLVERLVIAAPVAKQLSRGRPVVALESTLISHGLPYPQNLEVARAAEAAVRESGAAPATIAIRDGKVLVGLTDDDLVALATASSDSVMKAARPSLALALERPGWSATTVSATMIAAHAAGIRVFATGGIGGVHVGALGGASATFDISSDLDELARTPMAVVCAGPKAILDVPATLEYLETRGVPVLAVGQTDLPGFYASSSGIRAPASVADMAAAGVVTKIHLGLNIGSAILVCVPLPSADALDTELIRGTTKEATRDAEAAGVGGPQLTPWLLARMAELTDGATVKANAALIVNNARAAGVLAAALAMPV
jgi:pseudouridine-5'-phosphate glycosidase